jgi:hypothetical protein
MEFNGISLNFPWNSMEFSLEFHGIPWNSIEFYGFHGIPLNFMKVRLMEFHGIPWKIPSIDGI